MIHPRYLVSLPTLDQHKREVDERIRQITEAKQCKRKRKAK